MRELLACDKLLENERVIKAAKGLGVDLIKSSSIVSFGIVFDTRELGDVAFAMRDACVRHTWTEYLRDVLEQSDIHEFMNCKASNYQALKLSEPEHWIIASVLAWEAQEGKS